MRVLANNGSSACMICEFEAGVTAWKINKSVGLGGSNQKADVLKIQRLLNLIAQEEGGPLEPLKEDGIVGPFTLKAISGFQHFHQTGKDSRVDPLGPTLKRMNEVPKQRLINRNGERMARVATSMPDLRAMILKGLYTIQVAMDFLDGRPTLRKHYDLADHYFAFGNQNKGTTRGELGSIRTTFNRADTVLNRRPSPTGGNPFGISIYTIDPLDKDYKAYTPMERFDGNRDNPDVHSGHVYLCRGIDEKIPPDLFTHILLHELFHFVDDELKHPVVDYGYHEKALQLPHVLRMRNADNYALFASHVHFGRDRLLASQPKLRPFTPENL